MAPLLQSSRHTPCAENKNQSRRYAPYAINRIAGILISTLQFLILVFPANAGLRATYTVDERIILQEIAIPEAAGAYYREPGKLVVSEDRDRWFGPEIDSLVLCRKTAHAFNAAGFFDIIYTREDAKVWPSATPGKVWWYRQQEWRFADANTPWGTDTVHIILTAEIGWPEIDAANSVTGYPWSGFEAHWREGETIKSKAEIVGYHQYEQAGKRYLAPKYYKRGTSSYSCATARSHYDLKVLKHNEGHFTAPEFRPEVNKLSRREKGTSKDTSNWYDCISLKSAK